MTEQANGKTTSPLRLPPLTSLVAAAALGMEVLEQEAVAACSPAAAMLARPSLYGQTTHLSPPRKARSQRHKARTSRLKGPFSPHRRLCTPPTGSKVSEQQQVQAQAQAQVQAQAQALAQGQGQAAFFPTPRLSRAVLSSLRRPSSSTPLPLLPLLLLAGVWVPAGLGSRSRKEDICLLLLRLEALHLLALALALALVLVLVVVVGTIMPAALA